jgi:hypothetical protein
MALRGVATYYLKNYENNGIDLPTDRAGENAAANLRSTPKFIYRATATWRAEPWTLQLTVRGVSGGKYDNTWVECISGCPTSTINARTTTNNHIDGAYYLDANFTYDLPQIQGTQLFLNVSNVMNRDPEVVGYGPAGSAYGQPSTNPSIYDVLGRVFRAGVRFRY